MGAPTITTATTKTTPAPTITTADSQTTANAASALDEDTTGGMLWLGVVAAASGVLLVGLIVWIAVAAGTTRKKGKNGFEEDGDMEEPLTPKAVSTRFSDD